MRIARPAAAFAIGLGALGAMSASAFAGYDGSPNEPYVGGAPVPEQPRPINQTWTFRKLVREQPPGPDREQKAARELNDWVTAHPGTKVR